MGNALLNQTNVTKWNGSYAKTRWKRVWLAAPLFLFLDHLVREKWRAFDNVEISKQLLKSSFMENFLPAWKMLDFF